MSKKKAKRHEDNLFNRTSGRVHGYSSRLSRYIRLSISLRTSATYALLLMRMFIPLALILSILYGYLLAPSYAARRREALELLPNPEAPGVEMVLLDTPEPPDGFTAHAGWGAHWELEPFRVRVQYIEPYRAGYVQLLFSLEEDWRVLSGLLWGLLAMLGWVSFTFLTRGKRVNRKLLRPIYDITETAQQMNEKNLSARINVAGTQNELRDLAVVINDMLDRIEAAYNRQKQFVSDASHELRTPIAVIQGYAGLLERWGKDNPDVRDEAIEAITSETQSMKELVENLLFLARHDKKTLTLSYEPFDSAEMLREMAKETAIIAKGHQIEMGKIAECTLIADRQTVKQVVRVFVDNAIKYTRVGGRVTISSEQRDKALYIAVQDNGPGIKKADLARVFDRFYRADEARGSQTGGHGLGLAIARIIAASHGGKIHVQSKPGMGSTFTLEIPILEAEVA
ncbi:MAG: HAMP domain-containing histidine kinase [Firmicutes bacterium]|nr:HAMP domain-containing histidine kinase [Bacillota bacterium]